MSELMTRPVDTFTVGFKDREYLNELDSARRIASAFNTNHHEVMISDRDFIEFLPDMVYHQDEPIADPVCVPLYYVSNLARDSGTIVIQVGEGADEIFSGYKKYVRNLQVYQYAWRYRERLPKGLVAAAGMATHAVLGTLRTQPVIAELARRLSADEPMFWGGFVIFDGDTKPKILSKRMRDSSHSSLAVIEQYLGHIGQVRPGSDFLTRMIYLELKLRLPELLLMRVDKMTMATSVEARVPFLDHHLVEYAMGLPQEAKVVRGTGKHILKRALENILPHDLLYAKKRGFGAPIRELFAGDAGRPLGEKLLSSAIHKRGYFERSVINRMFEEHRRGRRDWSFHLWALLNLTLWYEHWIEGNGGL